MKIIVLILSCFICIGGLAACESNDNDDIWSVLDSELFPDVKPFSQTRVYSSYEEYVERIKILGFTDGTGIFKNTEETVIKNQDDIVNLAKNESEYEYNDTIIFYDKSSSMWRVVLWNGGLEPDHSIYINDKGITKSIWIEWEGIYFIE